MNEKIKISNVERLRVNESKKFATKISWGIIIIGLSATLLVMANKWLDNTHVQGVRITGLNLLDSIEISKYAGINSYTALKNLNLDSIETNVLKNPFVANAEVYRGETGNLKIDITERVPIARVIVGDSVMYSDSTAKLLDHRSSFSIIDVPIITGIMRSDKVDRNKLWQTLEVLKIIRDSVSELNSLVSEIQYATDGNFIIYLTDNSIPVLIGKELEQFPARLRKLRVFMENILSQKGGSQTNLIDLRWFGKVIVKWKSDQHELADSLLNNFVDSSVTTKNNHYHIPSLTTDFKSKFNGKSSKRELTKNINKVKEVDFNLENNISSDKNKLENVLNNKSNSIKPELLKNDKEKSIISKTTIDKSNNSSKAIPIIKSINTRLNNSENQVNRNKKNENTNGRLTKKIVDKDVKSKSLNSGSKSKKSDSISIKKIIPKSLDKSKKIENKQVIEKTKDDKKLALRNYERQKRNQLFNTIVVKKNSQNSENKSSEFIKEKNKRVGIKKTEIGVDKNR